jgi:pimeloyl-ACP methyl ester carboxylesterase
MPKSLIPCTAVLVLVHTSCGCLGTRHEVQSLEPLTGNEAGVVFSVDGAGGFLATTDSLRTAVGRQGLALRVEPVEWSHGWGRVIADQTDICYARVQGRRLAERVTAFRSACPGAAIYLVGHSAGCMVALAAVEELPPGTVDRVVLLAPSLSAAYDLRPALRGVRGGIDVFCSRRDWLYLGLGTIVVGTADRRWSAASGRVGFRPPEGPNEDLTPYAKLHQHPWNECQGWTGNQGGHYGGYQPAFLRAYVLPLLVPASGPQVNLCGVG